MNVSENFEALKGKTLLSVTNVGDTELVFITSDYRIYVLHHDQDCCEDVRIEDICGDLSDLIGEPLLVAEEVTHEEGETPDGITNPDDCDESFTWTFYKLDTRKGGVTIRFFGTSNGYYSESVDFKRIW